MTIDKLDIYFFEKKKYLYEQTMQKTRKKSSGRTLYKYFGNISAKLNFQKWNM